MVEAETQYRIITQHGTVWKDGYATRYAAERAAETNRNPHIKLTVEPVAECYLCGSKRGLELDDVDHRPEDNCYICHRCAAKAEIEAAMDAEY